MPKPLALKCFRIWKNGLDGTLYADQPGERWPVRVEVEVLRKRLTDAELAAEVHRFPMADFGYPEGDPDEITDEEWRQYGRDYLERQKALERFATLPHYGEEVPA